MFHNIGCPEKQKKQLLQEIYALYRTPSTRTVRRIECGFGLRLLRRRKVHGDREVMISHGTVSVVVKPISKYCTEYTSNLNVLRVETRDTSRPISQHNK